MGRRRVVVFLFGFKLQYTPGRSRDRITCANRKYGIARARHDDSSPFASPAFARPTPFGVYLCCRVHAQTAIRIRRTQLRHSPSRLWGLPRAVFQRSYTKTQAIRITHTTPFHGHIAHKNTRPPRGHLCTNARHRPLTLPVTLLPTHPPRGVPSHISERQSTHRLAESVAVQAISNRRQVTHAPSIAARR